MAIIGTLTPVIKNGDLADATVLMSLMTYIQSQVNTNAWSKSDLAAPSGASLVGHMPDGLGAIATTVQAYLRSLQGWDVNIKGAPFYAVGDGVANDTAAWLAFKAYLRITGGKGYMPAGTYIVDAFSFTAADSGLNISGESYNPMHSSFGVATTVIKLRSASAAFVTFSSCWNTHFEFIEFDGGFFADVLVSVPGTVGNTAFKNTFDYCSFYGPTPTTGVVFDFAGAVQGDFLTFNYCNIHGYGAYDFTGNALSLIRNTNSNAFNIHFNYCYFSSAIKMFDFDNGSCSFHRCDFYRAQSNFFYVRNVTQPFHVYDCYTEQSPGVPFLTQAGTAGVSSSYPITIEACPINATNAMVLNCQQPVRLIGLATSGNITISPMATYGKYPVYAESVNFAGGSDFAGSLDGYLTAINCTVGGVPRYETHAKPAIYPKTSLTYAGNVVVDAGIASAYSLNVTSGAAFTIDAPTSGQEAQVITFRIYNSSGGAMGVLTWAASYHLAGAFVSPAAAKNRSITFSKEGGVWYEQYRTMADVPS